MNMSGENDDCLYFRRSLIHHSYKNIPPRHPRRQAGIQNGGVSRILSVEKPRYSLFLQEGSMFVGLFSK